LCKFVSHQWARIDFTQKSAYDQHERGESEEDVEFQLKWAVD